MTQNIEQIIVTDISLVADSANSMQLNKLNDSLHLMQWRTNFNSEICLFLFDASCDNILGFHSFCVKMLVSK